jgi:hypothetical protein
LGYIIDLLEDPEDARRNLKPELQAVKKTANKCLESAQSFTSRFEWWYLVITHLKETSLSNRGEIFLFPVLIQRVCLSRTPC